MVPTARSTFLSSAVLVLTSVAAAQMTADPMSLIDARDRSERVGPGMGFVISPGTHDGHLEATLTDYRGELCFQVEARMNAFTESFSIRMEQGYVSGYVYGPECSRMPFEYMQPCGILSGFWSLDRDGSGQLEALMIGRDEATAQATTIGYLCGEFRLDRERHVVFNEARATASPARSGLTAGPPPTVSRADAGNAQTDATTAPGDLSDRAHDVGPASAIEADARALPTRDHPYGPCERWHDGPARDVTPAGPHDRAVREPVPGDLSDRTHAGGGASITTGMVTLHWGLVP